MPQRHFTRYPAPRINPKTLAHQIPQLILTLKYLPNSLHINNVLTLVPPHPAHPAILPKHRLQPVPTPLDHPPGKPPRVPPNHRNMLLIPVRIKQQVPRIKLNNDAPNRPHVTELVPAAAL